MPDGCSHPTQPSLLGIRSGRVWDRLIGLGQLIFSPLNNAWNSMGPGGSLIFPPKIGAGVGPLPASGFIPFILTRASRPIVTWLAATSDHRIVLHRILSSCPTSTYPALPKKSTINPRPRSLPPSTSSPAINSLLGPRSIIPLSGLSFTARGAAS